MANSNFVVHNGLTVGPLTIDATTGNINTSGSLTSTSTQPASFAGNVTISGNLTVLGATTTIQTEVATGSIIPSANLTYNLGSTTAWWNILYGKATQAQYADLAENYQADNYYEPGTVVEFGGNKEITLGSPDSKRVAGVVSTAPAHLMNGGLSGPNVSPLALQGRVPTKVIGPVAKGDIMVSAGFGFAKVNNDAQAGQIIGKALADFGGAKGVIEVVVGRF
jgi:hypothetical protein